MDLNDKTIKKIWESKKTGSIPPKQSRTEPFLRYKKYLLAISGGKSSPFARKKISVWSKCLDALPKNMVCLEFGVSSGKSINFFSNFLPECEFYGFDSFQGLPEPWVDPTGKLICKAGAFKANEKKIIFNKNIKIVKGLFEDTLPNFLIEKKDILKNIKFIHIDCDIYSSTKFVLDKCNEIILKNKPYILFDEFVNCKHGVDSDFVFDGNKIDITHGCESLAFSQFVERFNIDYEVIVSFLKPNKTALVLIKIK